MLVVVGVAIILERQGVAVVGVASNSAEALRRAGELGPDVTMVDLDLGGESGLERPSAVWASTLRSRSLRAARGSSR